MAARPKQSTRLPRLPRRHERSGLLAAMFDRPAGGIFLHSHIWLAPGNPVANHTSFPTSSQTVCEHSVAHHTPVSVSCQERRKRGTVLASIVCMYTVWSPTQRPPRTCPSSPPSPLCPPPSPPLVSSNTHHHAALSPMVYASTCARSPFESCLQRVNRTPCAAMGVPASRHVLLLERTGIAVDHPHRNSGEREERPKPTRNASISVPPTERPLPFSILSAAALARSRR
ncbi:hypothetical protein EJ04DRAFT_608414 [Polyplosphaeria fusca]|uniref:Uncharacterized protein n=1 Tax=Polyplosphaeria fusca TaxID=682080 RepID=A0A9P4UXP9_9PLEO|nr:hypothetical protein EJ04DRAFT_608414 [Polyplosphaeria fusca]